MQAADKRYREESEFLLLRNEVALQTLFRGEATAQPERYKIMLPLLFLVLFMA
jgi:hypothetical protein